MRHEILAGTATHVVQLAPGERPALLVHCSLAHAGAWGPLARALAAAGEAPALHAFDLPGHGRSDDWPGTPDYADLAVAVAAALADRLAAHGPVDLVGHSFGGVTALRLALERPGFVRSLALIEPVLFAAADPATLADLRAAQAPMAAALAAGDRAEAARAFLGQWGTGTPWEALPDTERAQCAARIHLIPAAAPALWDDAAGLLAPSRLEGLDRPCLILDGDRSPPVMAAICGRLAARLPRARRQTVAGAGHMLPVTHPAEVAAALAGLWRAA